MPFQGFPEEFLCRPPVAGLGHGAFQNLAFMADGAPKVVCPAVDLHEHLIQMPSPLPPGAHQIDAPAADFGGKHRAKSCPPEPHGFIADLDSAFVQQVLDIAQRQRETDGHHHRQPDDPGAGLEMPERGVLGHDKTLPAIRSGLKPGFSDRADGSLPHRAARRGTCFPASPRPAGNSRESRPPPRQRRPGAGNRGFRGRSARGDGQCVSGQPQGPEMIEEFSE